MHRDSAGARAHATSAGVNITMTKVCLQHTGEQSMAPHHHQKLILPILLRSSFRRPGHARSNFLCDIAARLLPHQLSNCSAVTGRTVRTRLTVLVLPYNRLGLGLGP